MNLKRRRHLAGKITLACFAAAALAGQSSLTLPAWVTPYPGANARTQTTPGLVESTYQTAAKPEDVMLHYRKLFDAAGIFFQPNFDGMGTAVRGVAPEGDLLILIRQQGKGTAVRVDLTGRSQSSAAPAAAPAAQGREHTQTVLEKAEAEHRKRLQGMEQYDQPMRPGRRPPPPELVWPPWLVHVDGGRLRIGKGVDPVGLKILQCAYLTYSDRDAVQSFYVDLLNAHGFPVAMNSSPSWPRNRAAWVDAANFKLGEGPGISIHIDLSQAGDALRVDLRMTARP